MLVFQLTTAHSMCLLIIMVFWGTLPAASLSQISKLPFERLKRETSLNSTGSPGSCALPPHPQHGVYVGAQCSPGDTRLVCRNTPGTAAPSFWLLKYSCHEGYDLTSSESEYSVCEKGIWKNPINCIKLCPPLRSQSVVVRCSYNGKEGSCDRPMRPGTTATARCRQYYTLSYVPAYRSLICLNNGEWNYKLYYCTPDCGQSTRVEGAKVNTVVPFVRNGEPAKRGEFPWLADLFMKNESDQWDQQCGGTLITDRIVLTVAHCLAKDGIPIQPGDVKVGLGKYYRDYYKYENYSVIADVREVVIPRFYSGANTFYALDIGLLDLVVSVRVTAFIMPACVDWSNTLPVHAGDIGHVAGWGSTEGGTASETILAASLQYIDNGSCVKRMRQVSKKFVTHDKFCAGSINGSQVDRGDSGGGITVVRNNLHFVFGAVSTKITDETSFTLFTDLTNTEHNKWLDDQRTRLDQVHVDTPETPCYLPPDPGHRRFCPVRCANCATCPLAPASAVTDPTIRVECEPGYRLEGATANYLMTCLNGAWSSEFPPCHLSNHAPEIESHSADRNNMTAGARLSTICIQCICEAVSRHRACIARTTGTCSNGVCGVFSLTRPYWQEAGRPTVGQDRHDTKEAFEKCALNNTCAEATIQGYMANFHQDCNGDGEETCEDYAAIHFHGRYSCRQPLDVANRNALEGCLERHSARAS